MSIFTSPASQLQVIIPPRRDGPQYKISYLNVKRVSCHRINARNEEEYLVEWKRPTSAVKPYSWNTLEELSDCLHEVQSYLDNDLPIFRRDYRNEARPTRGRKRKTPDDDPASSRSRSSVTRSSPASSTSSTQAAGHVTPDVDINAYSYYGTVKRWDGQITMEALPHRDHYYPRSLPTDPMKRRAGNVQTATSQAQLEIQKRFRAKLADLGRPAVTLINDVDDTTPPLDFHFINKSILGSGVEALGSETTIGCGQFKQGAMWCRPHMGASIGCEYSRICECLEYAAVDEKRMTEEQWERYRERPEEKMGLPKRFPYSNPDTARNAGVLVSFYLESRNPIYECNPRCNCGPICKTRVVQRGRKVPLEIFKTENRGWGLRCPEDLKRGQFIDTYRGQIVTNDEANDREAKGVGKASYLYSLDKHIGEEGLESIDDCYVVDGEYHGGPTRFMNHSCEPNCRQYTVSYNKHDFKVYELAFFAYEDIPAGVELTFDYLDKDDEEDDDVADEDGPPPASQESASGMKQEFECKCGSERCRGKLWM